MAQFSEFIKSDLFDTIPTNQLTIRREMQNEIRELTCNHELKFILNVYRSINDEKMRKDVIDLIHRERANYDKILIKIEDKKQGQLMKEDLMDVFNVALYNGDKKDVEINGMGKIHDKYDENRTIDIIISTSTIQSGQSLTENVLQIFIQTPIDTISSVEQFIGRNRLKCSTTHLFMRLTKDKCNVRQSMNRYEYHLNHLRAIAWHDMTVSSWQKVLSKLSRVIVDNSIKDSNDAANDETRQDITKNEATCCFLSENKSINNIIINKPLNKLFNGLKKLYKYYGFKSYPSGYMITMNKLTIKGKRTRCYKLIKDDETRATCRPLFESESTDETNEVNESTNNVNETSDAINDVNTSDTTNDATSDTINNKPLNQLFRGKRELFKFYNITTCPSNCVIKMKTLNESGKRTCAYWLTPNEAV